MLEFDLSGIWKFTSEGGEVSEINVPGGGWLKQGFDTEFAIYEREIEIPFCYDDQVTMLEIGGVNHHAQYLLGEDLDNLVFIYEETTAFTPQVVQLPKTFAPGNRYLLQIKVRSHQNGRPIAPHAANWSECIVRGLFGKAVLRVYPEVYIQEVFIKTFASTQKLSGEVVIVNSTEQKRKLDLNMSFSSFHGNFYEYPSIPTISLDLKPYEVKTIELPAISWTLGESSYWWPNVPYMQGYKSQLHLLNATLREERDNVDQFSRRFGFREIKQNGKYYELNGVRVNFRGDSLQIANYDRIDNYGKGDAMNTLPGFLPPSEGNGGWPEAVDHFMRLNYNVQRQHMMPWTPYMLDVCDELGLMLISESASRLNGFDRIEGKAPYEEKCLADIVNRDRHHPCVIRWSLVNEPQCDDPLYHLGLYNAVKALDDTRPISEDIWSEGYLKSSVEEAFSLLLHQPDFTWIEHYLSYAENGSIEHTSSRYNDAIIPLEDRPFGLGEANWNANGTPFALVNYATTIALLRAKDASDIRPYVLLSAWCSSIPGVKSSDFILEGDRFTPAFGEDNLPNPWEHPGIQLLQKACNPMLALDTEFWRINAQSNGAGAFPIILPKLIANERIVREITVFNDDFMDEQVELIVSLHSGNPQNRPFAQQQLTIRIGLGYHKNVEMSFMTPPLNTVIFLEIQVIKQGKVKFFDSSTCYEVVNGIISEWNYKVDDDESYHSLKLNTMEEYWDESNPTLSDIS